MSGGGPPRKVWKLTRKTRAEWREVRPHAFGHSYRAILFADRADGRPLSLGARTLYAILDTIPYSNGGPVTIEATVEDLAELLGASPSQTRRYLKELDGYLGDGLGAIVVEERPGAASWYTVIPVTDPERPP